MNKIIVNIPSEVNTYVQKLFYEYNAYLNILAFLNNNCDNTIAFKDYMEDSIQKNVELELAKETISAQYKPKQIEDSVPYDYQFNFLEETITYSF